MKYILSLRFPASEAGTTLDNLTPAYVAPDASVAWGSAASSYTVQTGGGLRLTSYLRDNTGYPMYAYGLPALDTGWMRCWRFLCYQTSPRTGGNNQYVTNGVRDDSSLGTNKLCYVTTVDSGNSAGRRDSTGAVYGSDTWYSHSMQSNASASFSCIYSGWISANGVGFQNTESRTNTNGIGRHSQYAFCDTGTKANALPYVHPIPYLSVYDRTTDTVNECWIDAMDIWDIPDTSGLTL